MRIHIINLDPKGPCTNIVYTLALKYSLYKYIGPKVYAIWVHGPLGGLPQKDPRDRKSKTRGLKLFDRNAMALSPLKV